MAEEFSIVGKSIPKVDGPELVTGQAEYSIDEFLPAMLYARILRSPHAHANIVSVDTSKAEALPGVRATLTYKDVLEIGIENHSRPGDQRVLDREVRYVGDEVAAVAADTEEVAVEALKLIDVKYEVLPAVGIMDPEEALKPDAPIVHSWYSPEHNLIGGEPWILEIGDIEQGFKESDRIYEGVFTSFPQAVNQPGRPCAVAWWQGDRLTIIDSNPSVRLFQNQVATWLQIPYNKVRYITKFCGVSMGGSNVYRYPGMAAFLARKTNRPVKVITDNRYGLCGSVRRRPRAKVYLRFGVKKDGTIMAMYAKMIWDKGASSASGPLAGYLTIEGLYECPNRKDETWAVWTNTPPNGSHRAYGGAVTYFALETFIDRIANDLGINPLEFRLKQYAKIRSRRPLEIAADRFGWQDKWTPPASKSGTKRRGIGIGSVIGWTTGYGGGSAATIRLLSDGTAQISSSVADIGTGSRTTLTQVAAEALGMKFEDITIICGDSILPEDTGSYGGRVAVAAGTAIHNASQDLKSKAFDILAPTLKVKPADLDARDGKIFVKTDPSRALTWKEAAAVVGTDVGDGCLIGWGYSPRRGPMIHINPISNHIAEVEVDTETGEVTVLHITDVHDVGQCLNRAICESQLAGAIGNAIGYTYLEDVVLDPATGASLNASHSGQRMTTILDYPTSLDLLPYEDEPNPCTPLGQSGFAESCIVPAAPAINNAIYNAIGVSSNDLPISSALILKLLGKV